MRTHRYFDIPADRAADDLLTGRVPGCDGDLTSLAVFVAAVRSTYTQTGPRTVAATLTAIFEAGLTPDAGDGPVDAAIPLPPAAADRPTQRTSRRRRMLTALSAFLATLTGKVVLGAAVVAASVGGAHAAGVVDVPGLPDRPSVVEDAPENQSGNRPDVEAGQPESPGVDGDGVSERATDGEPREDGEAFGRSVADEAVEGTPAEGLPANAGDAGQGLRPDTPAGGADAADDHRPEDTPAGRP
jgi:hypothetical protein